MAESAAQQTVVTLAGEYIAAEKKRDELAKKLRDQTNKVNEKFDELQAAVLAAGLLEKAAASAAPTTSS
jgi:tartrate dehydratase beta subunit/fumarate hydratase class I family protein